MPRLIYSNEKHGCGATIELDTKETVVISVAQMGVLVFLFDNKGGLIRRFLSNFFGVRLYNERDVHKAARTARALHLLYPKQADPLNFQNPVLAAFANAVWHCGFGG